MNIETLISIVTPIYNQGDLFWETFHSVLGQTFIHWEWLIINDGSDAPDTSRIFEKLEAMKDPRIKTVISAQNRGLPAARNTGVQMSGTNYIFFLDSDDLIEPDYLEKAWLALSLNTSFGFVNSWSTGFGAKNYEWRVGLEKRKGFLTQNWAAFAGLFRKDILLQVPFNESRREGLEDWEFWLAAASKGYWGYTIPEKLFHYRIHPPSAHKWENWDNGKKQKGIEKEFRKKYAGPLSRYFPDPGKTSFSGEYPALTLPSSVYSPEKTKPRILVVLPWLEHGGVEQFTLAWMRALQDRFDYILVTTNSSVRNDNKDFRGLCKVVFHLAHLADISLYPSLIRYIITCWRPDLIVLSHAEPFYQLLPSIRMAFPRLPVADINHIEDMQWQEGGYPKIASLFTTYIDKHVTVSNWLRQFMLQQGIAGSKIETVYINVDTDAIRPLGKEEKRLKRLKYNLPENRKIILFSGRLTHQKRALLLSDIAQLLVKRDIGFLLVVCGEGPDRNQLEEKVYRKGLGSYFHFAGGVPHTTAMDYTQCADILLLPSAWEGIATVLYEAMAAALAIITTDVGGHKELVGEDGGVVIRSGASDAELAEMMADALQRLIGDATLLQQMGQKARQRVVTHFDSKNTWRRFTEIFGELCNDNNILSVTHGSETTISQNYQDFVQRWNILHPYRGDVAWKQHRQLLRLRKIYKVLTRKRPFNYLWGGS
ncbi:MAG TPA: glycosyltransferase [Puia sp.]|nr:glycosyltransferase [Puia sp.]